jgi:hypothetical protein
MYKRIVLVCCLIACSTLAVLAQRPANAPATAPAGKAPDSVYIEDLTWAEVRDLIAAGTTNVIIGTAGTEQRGRTWSMASTSSSWNGRPTRSRA